MIKKYVKAFFMIVVMWIFSFFIKWAMVNSSLEISEMNGMLLKEGAKMLIGILVIGLLIHHKKHITIFRLKSILKGVFVYGLPVILFCAGVLIHSFHWMYTKGFSVFVKEFNQYVPYYLILFLAVAFGEELVNRAGILNYLESAHQNITKKGIVIRCIYSSVLFGIMHLSIWGSRMEARVDLEQIIFATLFGFSMSVIYLKTKDIISPMILHYIWNVTVAVYDLESYYVSKMGRTTEVALHQKMSNIDFIPDILMVICAVVILYRSSAEEFILNKPAEKIMQKEGEEEWGNG